MKSLYSISELAALAGVALGTFSAVSGSAQQAAPKKFATAREACAALFAAVKNHDEAAVKTIMGPQITRLISPDKPQEERDRAQFIAKYQEMRRLVKEPDGRTMLYIGAENWPFPIPLASTKTGWYFDTEAGVDEIMYRRIGEDEAHVMDKLRALTRTRKQAVANNQMEMYGYYFRALAGNAYNSTVKNAGGPVFVAYPAQYRVTGVMTFLVSPKGVVYEKDLGPNTVKRVKAMTHYQRDTTWLAAK